MIPLSYLSDDFRAKTLGTSVLLAGKRSDRRPAKDCKNCSIPLFYLSLASIIITVYRLCKRFTKLVCDFLKSFALRFGDVKINK